MRTPLAWKNLTHNLRKLLVAVSGIAFAVVLMFQQRGFQNALFDSTVEIVQEMDADIILVNPARFALTTEVRFPRELLDVAASLPAVRSAEPIYLENLGARLRRLGNRARPIRVIGFDLDQPSLIDRQREIVDQIPKLRGTNTALIDRLSQKSYGVSLGQGSAYPQGAELNGKSIDLVGSFISGRDFAHDGNLLMSNNNFSNYFPLRGGGKPLEVVDLGLIRVAHLAAIAEVQTLLQNTFQSQVRVLTKQQYIDQEIGFWNRNTPIGIIFMIGTVMGFVVGVIICYQILANDIAEHLGEFATLKAMGYGNLFFFGLVIRQSLYLAVLGFLPGWGISWLLFQFNSSFTGLLMHLTPQRILVVLLATMMMCIVSGLFALRKLLNADPASLF